MTAPVVLVVAAASGAGKTTLLERLIPALLTRGVRSAAVKLTHHVIDLDPAGKDSRRLRDAGAAAVALGGPALTTLFLAGRRDVAALARLTMSTSDVDLVLVEGGRDEPALPRVEVVLPGGSAVSDAALLIAVVGSGGAPDGVPTFDRDDTSGLADLLVRWLRPHPAPRSP